MQLRDIDALVAAYLERISAAQQLDQLESLRVSCLGKQGSLTVALKQIGQMPSAERKQAGEHINRARDRLLAAIGQQKQHLASAELAARLENERLDVTLPGRCAQFGSLHPVTLTIDRITTIFAQFGYQFATGPEIEDDWHNFEALNFPPNHPARAMHDTFYLKDSPYLLRTHTSGVQIRSMQQQQLPIRIISTGKVYRSDADQTHSPMFHQIEGLLIDTTTNFSHLKSTLNRFLAAFFESDVTTRFRPSYFPFTEPSAEVDIAWHRVSAPLQWLEVLGCGMVHPQVLTHVGIDPDRYSGFAFGLGVERLAMLRYGVDDLRAFFENDCRFLRQFR